MKQNKHACTMNKIQEIRFNIQEATGTWLVKHTPKIVLEKFKSGRYKDYSNRNETLPGFMPWCVTKFFINALISACYISSEELNEGPLGETYLSERNDLIG